MFRAIPVPNKICADKSRNYKMAKHQYQLSNIRSQIDDAPPETLGLQFLSNRKKKEKLLEERYCEIDRENRILLDKITNIMNKQNNKFQSIGSINNNYQTSIFQPYVQTSTDFKQKNIKSLNKGYRKREFVKISIENLAFLKRLSNQQSSYKIKSYAKDRANNLKYLNNICQFPPIMTGLPKSTSNNKRFVLSYNYNNLFLQIQQQRPYTDKQNFPFVQKNEENKNNQQIKHSESLQHEDLYQYKKIENQQIQNNEDNQSSSSQFITQQEDNLNDQQKKNISNQQSLEKKEIQEEEKVELKQQNSNQTIIEESQTQDQNTKTKEQEVIENNLQQNEQNLQTLEQQEEENSINNEEQQQK